jgi:energy-coupling factor transporter ATP-binding protein EcfA2
MARDINKRLDSLSDNPDTCIPLKNMFLLAGIEEGNIKVSLTKAREGTDNQFQNDLDRIADKTTSHFKAVWKEYRGIEFSLRLNADHIVPGVREKNVHDFERRSDGFKRFVTFLLIISVNVKTDKIQNTLLLIDEPEIGLHPSGARYLRNELIKISTKNYVVYSTHSIFMIDSGNIARHYIVKKSDEITTLEDAKASNIADEEVLFNALGHSVYSVLKEMSLIFEGWKDKHLFKTALGAASTTIQKKFADVGISHAKGVGSMKSITPMIELANRTCFIISDADKAAKEEQKLYKKDKGFGEWLTYADIDSSITALTGEDFVKKAHVIKQVNSVISAAGMPAFAEIDLPNDHDKLAVILRWLTANGMTQEQAKDALNQIKDAIFAKLKASDIADEYQKLMIGIQARV